MKPKLVSPWTRRRVVGWSGVAAAVLGAAKFGVRAAATPEEPPSTRLPAAARRPLAVAVPTGSRYAATAPVYDAIERVLPAVNEAARGRFALELMPYEHPEPAPDRPSGPQTNALAPLLGSGAAPDLLVFTSDPSPADPPLEFFAAANHRWLLPLDSDAGAVKLLPLGDFFPAAVDALRHRGQLLGLPLAAAPLQLLFDRRRLETAGWVSSVAHGLDWRRFREIAHRLSRDAVDGVTPDATLGFVPGPPRATLLSFLWQHGAEVVSADGTQARLAETLAVEALEYCAEFFRGGRCGRDALDCAVPFAPSNWRFSEEGVRYADRWWVTMLSRPEPIWSLPPEWSLAAAPLPVGRRRATPLAVSATISVNARSAQPAAAAEALTLLADRATREIVTPPRRVAPAALRQLDPDVGLADAETFLQSLEHGRTLVLDDLRKTLRLQRVLSDYLVTPLQFPGSPARSIRQTAAAAAAAVQAVLDQPLT